MKASPTVPFGPSFEVPVAAPAKRSYHWSALPSACRSAAAETAAGGHDPSQPHHIGPAERHRRPDLAAIAVAVANRRRCFGQCDRPGSRQQGAWPRPKFRQSAASSLPLNGPRERNGKRGRPDRDQSLEAFSPKEPSVGQFMLQCISYRAISYCSAVTARRACEISACTGPATLPRFRVERRGALPVEQSAMRHLKGTEQ